jgi:hypothetical protein
MDIGERTAPFISSAKETSIRPFQPQNSETAVNVHDKYMYNYYTDLSDVIAIVLFMTVLKAFWLKFTFLKN